MLNRLKAWWHTYLPAQACSPSVLSVYEQWRQQFFYQRLRLLIWLFLFVLVTLTVFELLVWRLRPEDIGQGNFVTNGVIGLIFVSSLFLQTMPWGKRHQGLIFWSVSAGITVTLLLVGVLQGNVSDTEVAIWSMVFLAQSTLVPVRWKLHMRSQLTLMIPLTALVTFAFFTAETAAARTDVVFGTIFAYIYLVWVCIVADLGVYLYERLRYREFEARQEVKTFLHAVSHDLRNPVTGTQLLIKSLLDQHGEIIPMHRSLLEQSLQSGERQLVLINSLLEAHNNNLKGLALQRQTIHLHMLVKSICHELTPQFANANITIHNQLSPDLPLIVGDPTQLWRVFNNLMMNALHHNPPGITIWLNASVVPSEPPQLRCTVHDNGIGMSSEQCAHLFSLYVQGHRRRHLSIGLGLHIAQQIIDAHGGTIGVDSELTQGSTFWLMLPLAHPALA
ncbi:MAG: HAMP domain-containing sensor histidine kinase [Cyanobacteria bacterium P01_H01_bin.105]